MRVKQWEDTGNSDQGYNGELARARGVSLR
jgi:hypothetical protein